ncbi:Trans-resveratrol di-O-methyltransferase [Platanthera guangdongensis]|uniref:Trans-resveratrol di-O-methyltransferase n=1 Tax=Platanthera guangdongensis TaxID=2320717 RepID=A0ABR2MVA3_9ASPA
MVTGAGGEILNDADVQETLKAHGVLWNHAMSFIKSMCLKCAIELDIPNAIFLHGMPATITELLEKLSIPEAKSRRLRILMRLLSREGIFKSHITLSGEEAFDLTPISHLLTTVTGDRPSSSPFILLLLNRYLVDPCQQLSHWFRLPDVATTPFEMAHGKSFWELAGDRPEFNELFNKGMASDSGFVMDVVTHIGGNAFRGVKTLVDVGGGTGMTAAALTEAFPGLACTVFDLPHVVETAERRKGIEFVGGDMFVEVPGADAVLLKWILHDWSDEDCVRILRRCKDAIPPKEGGGKVIIIDMVVGVGVHSQTSAQTQLLFDLEMMILTTGKERDEGEWRKLFVAAGFGDYKITPSIGLRSIIEVFP